MYFQSCIMCPPTEKDLLKRAMKFFEEKQSCLSPRNRSALENDIMTVSKYVAAKKLYRGHFSNCGWSDPKCTCGPDTCHCVLYSFAVHRFKNLEEFYLRHDTTSEWCPGKENCTCNVPLNERLQLITRKEDNAGYDTVD